MTWTPGLFDIQVNGFAGVDFNDAGLTAAHLDRALEAMLATGVTACLPTIITATPAELSARFAALDRAVSESRLGPLMVPGYHLEGPFLNPADGFAGCHPASAMTGADIALLDRLQGQLQRPILLVTVAPEVEGAVAFIKAATHKGVVVALGHSNASAEAVAAATKAGATMSTHLGNGVAHQQHKFDNPIWAQLGEDGLAASFIADGIHLSPNALKVMLRAKSFARSILVTDAVSAAAAPIGLYDFAGMTVDRREDGSVRLPNSPYLAGSALTMDAAVRNVTQWGLASFEDAVAMASDHPFAALASAMRFHAITAAKGRVRWTADHHIAAAEIDGHILFGAAV